MQTITVDKNDQQSKITGYIGTAVVHAILFAVMWFLVLGPADPPLTDTGGGMGLSMSLGEADMGGPSDMPVTEPQPQDPVPPQPETEQPVVVDETEQEPDAVVEQPKEIPKKVEPKKAPEKPVVTKTPEKPAEKPREADSRSLFKKRTTVVDGSGYGSGEAPGNQGSPDGKPDGDPNGSGDGYGQGGSGGGIGTGHGRGTGPGNGDGISYDLKGRSIQRKPTIVDTSKETGKVVVSIVVDRNGRVTKAMPNQRGTTTLNPVLLEKARQGAMETKFSPKPDGPEEQFGTMTIEFKFKP